MKGLFVTVNLLLSLAGIAQKQVQTLPAARLGIFKNGTCFVKREAVVKVAEKSFYINAPQKVLMGTYWVFVGKESSLQSIVIKTDTFKVKNQPKYMTEFLEASVGQVVTVYRSSQNTETSKLTGKLVEFNKESGLMKMESANGKTFILNGQFLDWLEVAGSPKGMVTTDSILPVAQVKLNKEVDNIMASTISLERGVQWFPSYLLTLVNDKEAKLEMKATIANGETAYMNMPVDIIIGNPEMFYGKTLDPACIDYLSESMVGSRYDNNTYALNVVNVSQAYRPAPETVTYEWNDDDNSVQKEGSKLEDLYYYQLGTLDLEKNARVVVPVTTTTVNYTEMYTASLPVNSTSLEGDKSVQTYHSYYIHNNSNAPFTTGAILVMNQQNQPLAQAQLAYTPVKGSSVLQLSKAVDVQVKNDEEETSREKSNVKRTASAYYERINSSGLITVTNYKDKKITMKVSKRIEGIYVRSDNGGKSRKVKAGEDDSEAETEIYWEVEIPAGGKLQLKYDYYKLD